MSAAPADPRSAAGGMLATGRTMDQAISVAIAGAVFGTLGGADAGSGLFQRPRDRRCRRRRPRLLRRAAGMRAIAALGVVTSLRRGSEHRR